MKVNFPLLRRTDIFMHAVDPKTNKVVDKNTALT